jgi:hypothetical protein
MDAQNWVCHRAEFPEVLDEHVRSGRPPPQGIDADQMPSQGSLYLPKSEARAAPCPCRCLLGLRGPSRVANAYRRPHAVAPQTRRIIWAREAVNAARRATHSGNKLGRASSRERSPSSALAGWRLCVRAQQTKTDGRLRNCRPGGQKCRARVWAWATRTVQVGRPGTTAHGMRAPKIDRHVLLSWKLAGTNPGALLFVDARRCSSVGVSCLPRAGARRDA